MSGWRNWRADGARVVEPGGLVAVCDSVDIARAVAAIPHATVAIEQLLTLVSGWAKQHEVDLEAVPEVAGARVALAGLRGRILRGGQHLSEIPPLGAEECQRLLDERDAALAEAARWREEAAKYLGPHDVATDDKELPR